MKSIARNAIFNTLYTGANLLYQLISTVYVANILLADGVGKVAYVQNIASFFVLFAGLGIPTYGVKEISRVRGAGGDVNKVFSELFLINGIATVLSSLVYGLIFVAGMADNHSDQILYSCFGIQIVMNCINIDWLYQGLEEYGIIAARSIVVKLFSAFLLLTFVNSKEDYVFYALITVFAVCGNYLLNILYAKKIVSLTFSDLSPKQHLIPVLVTAVSIVLASIYSRIDVTMLGIMCTETDVGLYTVAHKSVDMIITVCVAMLSVFLPRLSACYAANRKQFSQLLDLGVRLLLFFAVPIFAGVFILAPDVIPMLFGTSFVQASLTLRIFSVLLIVKTFGHLLCYQLVIITGNEKKRLPAYFAAAVANVVLNAVLIPEMGCNGAALASVVSELIVNGWQVISMKRIVEIPFSKAAFLQSIFSTAAMCAGIMCCYAATNHPWIRIVGSIVSGVVVYVITNYFLKNRIVVEVWNQIKAGLQLLLRES